MTYELKFTKEEEKRLEELRKRTGAASREAVIIKALNVLSALEQRDASGKTMPRIFNTRSK